jgi:hypothetical protein
VAYRDLSKLGKQRDISDVTDAELSHFIAEGVTQMMDVLDTAYADNYIASLF